MYSLFLLLLKGGLLDPIFVDNDGLCIKAYSVIHLPPSYDPVVVEIWCPATKTSLLSLQIFPTQILTLGEIKVHATDVWGEVRLSLLYSCSCFHFCE